MRPLIYAATTSLAMLGAVGHADAMSVNRFASAAILSDVEQAQFFYGGQNYCWYDNGWRDPGFYWCGYAWRSGLGWGGGAGWHGWGRGGGRGGRPGGHGHGGGGGHGGHGGGGHGGGGHGGHR